MARFFNRRDPSGSASGSSDFAERRSGEDRRTHRFPELKYLLFAGQRAHARRKEDWHRTFYFDR